MVIGVLGGIASGKSTVARLLARGGGERIDADALARAVLEEPEVVARLRAELGEEVLGPDGRPDRAALARAVFSDPVRRRVLEGLIHPEVRTRIGERLEALRARGVPRVVLDVPLLLEKDAQHGLASACDALVFVEADPAERERRAMRDRGWPAGEMARREAQQAPLPEKRSRAHHVIRNDGDLAHLEASVQRLLDRLESARSGR